MVIAIIGILAAVLIPTFTGAIESARIAGGTSNARNLSTLLMTEAAYDNTAYLPTDRVWEIAEENNISLESEVGHYSYWYDASANRVTYAETASMLSGAANLNAARAAGDYPFEPETLVEGQTNYRYIERSDNPIREALDVIRGVSGNSSAAEIDSSLTAAIEGLGEYASLSDHFELFKTASCVYFTDNGVVKGSGTTFDYAVLPFNTAVLPTLTAEQNITIFHEIALPASVSIVSTNAFFGVTADVSASSAVVVEGNTGLTGNFNQTAPAGNVINITGEDVNDYLEINFKDTTYNEDETVNVPGGTWVYYQNGKPVSYTGNIAEATAKNFDYAYKMPAVTLKGGEKGSFFDRVEKLTVRSKLVSGGIEFVMVAVDSSYNVYKLSGVGIVTEVGVSWEMFNEITVGAERVDISAENCGGTDGQLARSFKVLLPEAVKSFDNIQDFKVKVYYRTGTASYATETTAWGSSVKRISAPASWAAVETPVTSTVGELNTANSMTVQVAGGSGTSGSFTVTECKESKIELYAPAADGSEILVYVRNYAE